MMTRASATVLAVFMSLAACAGSASDDLNPGFVSAVDALRSNGDCVALQAFFDRSDEVDELRYIDRALERAGCYD